MILFICLGNDRSFPFRFIGFFFFFLVGYPPFSESPDSPQLTEQILKGLYTFPDAFWSAVSAPAKDLIRQMMCVDPTKRLSMKAVLEHPWLATDHENTSRVDKFLSTSPLPTRSAKRLPEDISMDDMTDKSIGADGSTARYKRSKH